MIRMRVLTAAIGLTAASLVVTSLAGTSPAATWPVSTALEDEGPSNGTMTSTGWFSDIGCAAPRVKRGIIGPNNPDCVKSCLDKGSTPVFISEQAKALFEVKGYPSVKEDVGWHIELTGTVDEDRKTITVASVKRLEYVGAQCGLRKKGTQDSQKTSSQ